MKVHELIAKLQQMPSDLEVVSNDRYDGVWPLSDVEIVSERPLWKDRPNTDGVPFLETVAAIEKIAAIDVVMIS